MVKNPRDESNPNRSTCKIRCYYEAWLVNNDIQRREVETLKAKKCKEAEFLSGGKPPHRIEFPLLNA